MGLLSEVGLQAGDVKNSPKSSVSKAKPSPSRLMNTKMPMMKTIAEIPPAKTR